MMKRLIETLICAAVLITGIVVVSCEKDDKDSKHCTKSSSPYYCSSSKTCCGYRYNDGKGTCWETMEGCRSSGNACETCHIEDD